LVGIYRSIKLKGALSCMSEVLKKEAASQSGKARGITRMTTKVIAQMRRSIDPHFFARETASW
jgi:hypothetical protein